MVQSQHSAPLKGKKTMTLRRSIIIAVNSFLIGSLIYFSSLAAALAGNPQIDVIGVANLQSYNSNVTPVIDITGDNLNNAATVIELNGKPFVSGTTISQEGTYTLYIKAEDLFATQTEQTINFKIDKTAPAINIVGISSNLHIRGTIQLQANILEPNLAAISVKFDGQEIGTTLPLQLNTMNYSDGGHTISIEVTDSANNSSISSMSIIIDNTRPGGTITANSGARYTNSRIVTLALHAEDNIKIEKMRIRNGGGQWSDWLDHATRKRWTLASGNGYKTVYVQFKDMAGNRSIFKKDAIVLDTQKPTGSVTVKSDAPFTSKRKVGLLLTSSDNYEIGKVRFRNANGNWSRWYPYKRFKEWFLPRIDGSKRVLAQFKDKAGNISKIVSDTIFLDSRAPTAAITAPKSIITELPSITINVQWAGSDATPSSGIGSYEVQYKRATDLNWLPWLTKTASNTATFAAVPGATYIFRARATDKAGNIGTWSVETRMAITDYYGQFITEPTVVLIRSQQRIRIYDGNGMMLRTFLVSTGKYAPVPGTYRVYSKSPQSRSTNGRVQMKHMVRFTRASSGVAIGFHSVIYNKNGVIDREKLGQPVSAGCVRSDFPNAKFIYNFAPIGTKVWVTK